MQTATEQLMIALYEGGYLRGNGNEMDDILEKYKQVFKQQIEKTFDDAVESEILGKKIIAEKYYNETYGSKGSDETNGNNVEKVLNVVTPFLEGYEQINQDNPVTRGSTALVKVASSQTEISEPNPQLIESMCYRYRHDFGFLKDNHKESIRTTMKQLWEEVVGKGFYKQKEISDDEIEKAKEYHWSYRNGFVEGAKWYREQIKKKQ